MGVIDGGWDITNLCVGAVRAVYARRASLATAQLPRHIEDILDLDTPYTLTSPFEDFGATTGPATYSRGITAQGLEIEQVSGNIIESITDVARSIKLPVAEISPENMRIVENAGAPQVGYRDDERLPIGKFSSLDPFCVALVGQRDLSAGAVIEGAGGTRGRMVVQVLYKATIAAENVSFDAAKGQLASGDLTFTAFPEPGLASNEEDGLWLFEKAGHAGS